MAASTSNPEAALVIILLFCQFQKDKIAESGRGFQNLL
jgi:hypothetical protein